MTKIPHILALTFLFFNPLFVSAYDVVSCDDLTAPVTSVADFDANGVVNGKDIRMLAKYVRKNGKSASHRNKNRSHSHRSRHNRNYKTFYSPLFDRNADGELDNIDLFLATRDMGKTSNQTDQKLATISNEIITGTNTCIEEPAATTNEAPTTPTETTACPSTALLGCDADGNVIPY